jgi:LAO/AO transport system kinase
MDAALIESLARGIRDGDVKSLARAISLIETGSPEGRALATVLYDGESSVRSIGVTGPPGVGKSTLVDRLVASMRSRSEGVAVLAVDPSSPISGGAILGDRVRMVAHADDIGVFIRSMASRGQLGGLAAAAGQALAVLSGGRFDKVVVESVGVGQSEIDVARATDTAVVVVDPTFGDGVQVEKAGLLEVADVLVVNKSDLGGYSDMQTMLREMVSRGSDGGWSPPVVAVSALENEGIEEVIQAVDRHVALGEQTGALVGRRSTSARAQFEAHLYGVLSKSLTNTDSITGGRATDVASLRVDPWSAADAVIRSLGLA